ncbi:MAG: NUDIX domain-containing protein [Planctomycetota bacterium]
MKQPFAYSYPRPALTVDVILFAIIESRLRVLLIERKHEPFAGHWAFPGGFVDEGETLESAARRELVEETGVRCGPLFTVGTFGDPGRDPRGWTVSAVYYGVFPNPLFQVQAGDDAANVKWKLVRPRPPLAFDHAFILRTALDRLRREVYLLPVAKPLLPRDFSLVQLEKVYRALDPRCPAKAVLKRRLMDVGLVGSSRRSSSQLRFQ